MLPAIQIPSIRTGAFAFGANGAGRAAANFSYNPVYVPHLQNTTRTQIQYGGSSSGKSVFLAQRCVGDLLSGKRNYLICRAVAASIKTSVFAEVKAAIESANLSHLFKINESDRIITCITNGRQAIFKGLDDVEKIKSIRPARGSITDIWIEESTEANEKDVKQLVKRQRGGDASVPKRLTLSFNPILQSHWIYQTYFAPIAWADDQREYRGERLSILKTTYVDNKFLTADDIYDLENESDPYFRDVYTFGKWGVLGDVIFTNWRVEDLSGMRDQFNNQRNGLDFGFSSDPAAVVATHYDRMRRTIYIHGELYERGLMNNQLAQELKDGIFGEIVCDSAEPKSIAELQNYGIQARPARKGKDSVVHGIQWLQQQTIIIDSQCVNARNEFQQYQWRKDKDGNSLRQPVDKNNHIIDALRYAYEDESAGGIAAGTVNYA